MRQIVPPTASFVFGPESPFVDKAVAFDGSASTDDGTIKTYYWEFGDGFDANGKTVTHHFGDPGRFEVTLWVTDDEGQTSSVTREIVVQ